MQNDSDESSLSNLEKGATIGYNNDLGNPQQVSPVETRRRGYYEARDFLATTQWPLVKKKIANVL